MVDAAPIEVARLSKWFGSVRVVDDLSFAVAPPTITGFLGPNGAGKTTTLRMLLGLVAPDAGTATIGGVPYRRLAELHAGSVPPWTSRGSIPRERGATTSASSQRTSGSTAVVPTRSSTWSG